jgi:4'-phosphopantetheinyl transferase
MTGLPASALAFRRNSHGKPRLAGAEPIAFNISHSGDLVAIAIGRNCDLGIDVERHRPELDVDALGRFIFTDAEMAAVQAGDARARINGFFRQWVFKEALVKGLGTGLARDPRRFQIRNGTDEPFAEFVGGEENDIGQGWRLRALAAPAGYSTAVAIRQHER